MIEAYRPLADRLRPQSLDEYIGQSHILGQGKPLRTSIEQGVLHSLVFWGPPGTGKTTLARMLAKQANAHFMSLSAVLSGVKDIREAVELARQRRASSGQLSVLFVDEVHRFNKSQQDAFLPHIEDGTIIFVGATTENPSFELNNALLSRLRVYVLKSFSEAELSQLLQRALQSEEGLADRFTITEDASAMLVRAADGDGRRLLNLLEIATDLCDGPELQVEHIEAVVAEGLRRFDKGGEYFYDQISALHKSMRGSDPDAALYWFARMVDGGVDTSYLARRIVRMAAEDVGNADPRALSLCLDAWSTYDRLGSPEGELALAQALVYITMAPKSNAVYMAYKQAMADVKKHGTLEVPLHIRNAPTRLMKELGYGQEYRYAHDEAGAFAAGEKYFPDEMPETHYYNPVARGLEIKIGEKLAQLRQANLEARRAKGKPEK